MKKKIYTAAEAHEAIRLMEEVQSDFAHDIAGIRRGGLRIMPDINFELLTARVRSIYITAGQARGQIATQGYQARLERASECMEEIMNHAQLIIEMLGETMLPQGKDERERPTPEGGTPEPELERVDDTE